MTKQTLPLEKKDVIRLRLNFLKLIFIVPSILAAVLYGVIRETDSFQNIQFNNVGMYMLVLFSLSFLVVVSFSVVGFLKSFKRKEKIRVRGYVTKKKRVSGGGESPDCYYIFIEGEGFKVEKKYYKKVIRNDLVQFDFVEDISVSLSIGYYGRTMPPKTA